MQFVWAIAAGWVLGGVINLILYRLPRERRLFSRPHCVCCGHPLNWEFLPLVGYLLQRGRCRHCHQTLPSFFPLVELLTILVFVLLVWRHGLGPMAGLYALFGLSLILTLFLDWQHHYIYYSIVVPSVALALLGNWLHPHLNVLNSLISLAIATAFFVLLFVFGKVLFQTEALGTGDILLAGTIGAMFGFPGALTALAGGMALAGLVGALLLLFKKSSAGDFMAYGSFLCMGALAHLCLWAP